MTVCPKCKGVGCVGATQDTCLACNGTGEVRVTNFERITQNEKTLAEFIYCLNEVFDYYAGNGAVKISQYANEDANDKNHIELIHGNRDFDELVEWLKQPHTKE